MRRLVTCVVVASGVALGTGWALRRRYGTPLRPALHSAAAEAAEVVAAARGAMAEREEQLRSALGLDVAPGTEPLEPQVARELLEDPAGAFPARP